MKVDIASRQRIIREREQRSLVKNLVESLKPPVKEDTITEPVNKLVSGTNRSSNILTILVAFSQKIVKTLNEYKDLFATPSNVKEVKDEISLLRDDVRNALGVNVVDTEENSKKKVSDTKVTKKTGVKNDEQNIISAINSLNESVIELTNILKYKEKDGMI